ncbi:MAG: ABC transporter permease [Candidatus Acidiferrum sp.]
MKLLSSLKQLFKRRRLYQDLSEEMQQHLDEKIEELVATGMLRKEAIAAARRAFGNMTLIENDSREVWQRPSLEDVFIDVRFALRTLRKTPGFTTVAVLTLALGIGANTAMFSVVEGVVLAPLPYFQPDRLVMVLESNLRFPQDSISYPNFLDWQRDSHSFQRMAAYAWQGYNLTNPGTPEHLDGKNISSGFFSTLGVELTLGREFSPQEDHRGGTPVVIISNRLWRSRFGSSRQALGKTLTLDGADYTIVGVLPPGFRFGDQIAAVYIPLGQCNPLILADRGAHTMASVARLEPGVTISQAQAEMTTIQDHLDELYPDANRGTGTTLVPLKQIFVGDVSATLLLLLGAVGFVLLIASANVANLLLARSTARRREFAIRSALGASRGRIVRQLITESMLLSLAGGALGALLAIGGVHPLLAAVPGSLPRSEGIGVNAPVLWFTLAVSLVVGILFGLAPAFRSSKTDVQASLKAGGRGSTNIHHRAQSSLLIVQMALTLVLLVGAGLLLRTIRHLWASNPGFDTQRVIAFKVGVSPSLTETAPATRIAYQQLIDRIRSIPGVQAADFTGLVPLSGMDGDMPFWIGSHRPVSLQNAPRLLGFLTGPDYFRTMGIPLLRGRLFGANDTTKSPCVVIIDSVFTHMYFPDSDPIGQTLTFAFTPVGPCRIIGVVGHVKHWGLGGPNGGTQNEMYFPLHQDPDPWVASNYAGLTVVIRTPLDAAAVMPAIKSAVYAVGGEQPVYNVQTMREIVSRSMSSRRFPLILLGTFAGLALLLASVGIYGVISYSVSQRIHEIGIRMALGAGKQNVFRMVVGHGLRLALAGLAIGTVAALILTRVLSSFSHLLYGVGTNDPVTFIAVSFVLAGVAILACYVPARRATRVDPMVALRYE